MPTTLVMGREVLDVLLELDSEAGSQSRQVQLSLRAAILDGRLAPGLRLPSSRKLARQLGVRRNAVVAAYEHLLCDGLATARRGAGTFIAPNLPVRSDAVNPNPPALSTQRSILRPFALGNTIVDTTFMRSFGRMLRKQVASSGASELGYGDPRGMEALRQQVSAHLAVSRGIRCDPACIVIVSGVQQALRLCTEALLTRGDGVWVEDPGYPVAHRTLQAAGLQLIPVPVDAHGIDVTAACNARSNAAPKAAYVTPSHQFPLGVSMSMARRIALLEWACAEGAWVLEDDYDNEFRYAGPPLTALAGLDRGDRVIYIGTFSKTLFPGLRIAYAVLPPAAVAPIMAVRATHDRFPPPLIEGALATSMADGDYVAHVRRVRNRYRAARDALAIALERFSRGVLKIKVPEQGLHLLAMLPDWASPVAASAIRDQAGVETVLLSETRIQPQGPDGFILGYAGYTVSDLTEAAQMLGQAALEHLHIGAGSTAAS